MGDVGKETHVHLVGAQFLFLFHLSLSGCSSGLHHALGVLVEIASQHDAQNQIDEPSPPREHRRRFYHHLDGSFVAVAFVAGVVGSPHSEGIVTSRQIGIAGRMVATRIDPVSVESVQFIIIMYALIFSKVESGIRDAEAVFAMFQTNLLTAVEHHLDGSVLSRANQLVVHLQVAELQRYLSQGVDIRRVEHGNAICTTKHQTTIGQNARGTIAELIASDAIGLIERGDTPRLGIQSVQTFHRTDPEIALMACLDAGHIGA